MTNRFQVSLQAGRETTDQGDRLPAAGPMNILVMGDFSGRGAPGRPQPPGEIGPRPLLPVDIDNLDELIGRLAPAVQVQPAAGSPAIRVAFRCLEDFHPDSLLQRLEIFQTLQSVPGADAGPEDDDRGTETTTPPVADGTAPVSQPADEKDAELLGRLLGKAPTAAGLEQAQRKAGQSLQQQRAVEVVRRLAETAIPSQPVADKGSTLDQGAAGRLMRTLLHDPAFQALEAAWRSLDWLIRSVETGEDLRVFLLDSSEDEIAADLAGSADVVTSAVYRKLSETLGRASSSPGFSLLIGNFSFGNKDRDIPLLNAFGRLAAKLGSPFIAGGAPNLVGCQSFGQTPYLEQWQPQAEKDQHRWQVFRASPAARWVALALPRVLLRLPYGPETDPVETFPFDEFADSREHEDLLWGNPAFACAILLATQSATSGGGGPRGAPARLDQLPAYSYRENGETRLQPCAEVLLGEREVDALLAMGLIPVLSEPNRNLVHIPWLQPLGVPTDDLTARRQ